MTLTYEDHTVILDNMFIAELAAASMPLIAHRDELIASGYYAICKAALVRPRPIHFKNYAWRACTRQILLDHQHGFFRGRKLKTETLWAIEHGELDPNTPVEEMLINQEQRHALEEAINILPQHQQNIIRRTLNGQDGTSIAKDLNRNRAATYVHKSAATRKLKAHLENQARNPPDSQDKQNTPVPNVIPICTY